MTRKKNIEWDREKKIHKVVKGTDKFAKHRKSLYNMLSGDEQEPDNDYSEVKYSYHGNSNYTKHR